MDEEEIAGFKVEGKGLKELKVRVRQPEGRSLGFFLQPIGMEGFQAAVIEKERPVFPLQIEVEKQLLMIAPEADHIP
jgi:hypothetical protein